jgi:hypothetical protein
MRRAVVMHKWTPTLRGRTPTRRDGPRATRRGAARRGGAENMARLARRGWAWITILLAGAVAPGFVGSHPLAY